MSLTLEKIEKVIASMDQDYDANFGEWIRNEVNAKIVAHHLKKYILEYPIHDFVIVLKWVVKDWTLRSIIILTKIMIINDIDDSFDTKITILHGLIHTWHSAFISEFIISTSKMINETLRKIYMQRLLIDFEKERAELILKEIGDKMEHSVKETVLSEIDTNKTKKMGKKKKKLYDAFNIL